MGLLLTGVGTWTTTGVQTAYVSLGTTPTKMYISIVGKDGGVSVASGSVGFATESDEFVSSYGRKGTNSSTEKRTDRCVHFYKVNSNGSKTTLVSASFMEFDDSLSQFGLMGLKFDVSDADSGYSYLFRLED